MTDSHRGTRHTHDDLGGLRRSQRPMRTVVAGVALAFAQAGLHDNPYPKLAALGTFTFDALPGADDPAYLAETPAIVLKYLQGLDAAGIDSERLAQAFVDSGSVDAQESWVAGFDPAILQGAQRQAQQALAAYIQNNLTDPTVGEIVGGRKTIVQEYPVLPSGLPYKTLVTGARYGTLPDKLRHHMRLAFQKDILGAPIDPVTYPWAQLNNRRLTLSFRPAAPADEEALQALLPDGEITDIGQLPDSIPAYLIEVVPELKLDGQAIKTGAPMRLGDELAFAFQTLHPTETQSPYSYRSSPAPTWPSPCSDRTSRRRASPAPNGASPRPRPPWKARSPTASPTSPGKTCSGTCSTPAPWAIPHTAAVCVFQDGRNKAIPDSLPITKRRSLLPLRFQTRLLQNAPSPPGRRLQGWRR